MRKLIIFSTILGLGLVCLIGVLIVFMIQGTRIDDTQFPLEPKWIFEASDQIRSTPVVGDNKILIRTKDILYAIDGETGYLIWSFQLTEDWKAAAPIVQKDIVIVVDYNNIVALDLSSGKILWQIQDTKIRAFSFPAASNDKIVIIVNEGISVRDIQTGTLINEIKNPIPRTNVAAVLSDQMLYTVFKDNIRGYDVVDTRNALWQEKTEKWFLSTELFEDDIFYLERDEGGISAYNVKKQTLLWSRVGIRSRYPPVKSNNFLILGRKNNVPIALDALNGETLWIAGDLPDDHYQTPLVFNNQVYIRGLFQQKIYVLHLQTGQLVGNISLGRSMFFSTNSDYSLGPIQFQDSVIFPAGNQLLSYE